MNGIGQALGRDRSSIHYVVRCRGGIAAVVRRRSRLALTLVEREDISRGIAVGWSIRRIAYDLGRSASTVSRAEVATDRHE
jgi:IS30 family transposase